MEKKENDDVYTSRHTDKQSCTDCRPTRVSNSGPSAIFSSSALSLSLSAFAALAGFFLFTVAAYNLGSAVVAVLHVFRCYFFRRMLSMIGAQISKEINLKAEKRARG